MDSVPRLRGEQAKDALLRCFATGEVVLTRHFHDELAEDDLTMVEVLAVCRSGAVIREPEQDIKTGEWKYRIEGRTVDGRDIAVVFAFQRERGVLITVWEAK